VGAALLCENAFARIDRGGGLPCPFRLPYFPDAAAAQLSKYSVLVLIDARRPVANFGYQCAPCFTAQCSRTKPPACRFGPALSQCRQRGLTCIAA
jgi:hypothetical protein